MTQFPLDREDRRVSKVESWCGQFPSPPGGRGGGVGLVAAMPEGLRLQGEIQSAGEAPVGVTVVRREGVQSQGVLKHQRRLNRGEAHVIAYRSTTCSVGLIRTAHTCSNLRLSVTPAQLMRPGIGLVLAKTSLAQWVTLHNMYIGLSFSFLEMCFTDCSYMYIV